MGENNEVLNKILVELLQSKELNKELFSEVKTTLKNFETDIEKITEKQNIDKQELKDLISKIEKELNDNVQKIEKEQSNKINNLEKKVLEIDFKAQENTKDHKDNQDTLKKFGFLILSAFVGLIVYVIKGN